jgi:ferritin-like metal-binding protein YciE
MASKTLRELFVEELRDMYDGEKQLTRALTKMAKASESDELQTAFTSHLGETEKQVARLEQVFRSIGETARRKKCEGIQGIVEEGKAAMEELAGAVLDAALIAGAQKVEHYEIASYGTLAYFAELLGEDTAKQLLGQTLDEEKAANDKLTQIAKSRVNREALLEAGNEKHMAVEGVGSRTAERSTKR